MLKKSLVLLLLVSPLSFAETKTCSQVKIKEVKSGLAGTAFKINGAACAGSDYVCISKKDGYLEGSDAASIKSTVLTAFSMGGDVDVTVETGQQGCNGYPMISEIKASGIWDYEEPEPILFCNATALNYYTFKYSSPNKTNDAQHVFTMARAFPQIDVGQTTSHTETHTRNGYCSGSTRMYGWQSKVTTSYKCQADGTFELQQKQYTQTQLSRPSSCGSVGWDPG